VAAVLCLGALLILRLWILEPTIVRSTSMAPTLPEGSLVWLDKISPDLLGVQAGQLVTFRSPDDGGIMVKRVVAVAGQSVSMQDGVLNIDGVAVNEPYVDQRTIDGAYFGTVRLGTNEIFVMGDNRGTSIDSRTFGPIPADIVEATVIGVR
jgi:signal peptidase I